MGKWRFLSEICDGDRLISIKYRGHSFLIEIKDMRRLFTLMPASRGARDRRPDGARPISPIEPGGTGNGNTIIYRDRGAINYRGHAHVRLQKPADFAGDFHTTLDALGLLRPRPAKTSCANNQPLRHNYAQPRLSRLAGAACDTRRSPRRSDLRWRRRSMARGWVSGEIPAYYCYRTLCPTRQSGRRCSTTKLVGDKRSRTPSSPPASSSRPLSSHR